MATFSNLPLDILVLVFPYLDANSFLSLCATCKSFNHADIRLQSSYWNHATRTKFRVPNRPSAQADGLHWLRLYKRLLTQSRVYTWGRDDRGCLGHGFDQIDSPIIPRRGMQPRPPRFRFREIDKSWPEEMKAARELGVIADLQCGGWSTSLLSDKGVLYTVGVLNGSNRFGMQSELTPMKFPVRTDGTEAQVAIRQFSSGRTHILGLSDNNTIWSWNDVELAGTSVKLDNLGSISGKVHSVVAGWNKSSAFLPGTGIVLWKIIGSGTNEVTTQEDWVVVPRSSYQRPIGKRREPDEETRIIGATVGEVTNYIVLEDFVVFVTDLKKVFAARIHWPSESGVIHDSFELQDLQALSPGDMTPCVTDVNGSFRTFAVFKDNGEVDIANQDYLSAYLTRTFNDGTTILPPATIVPALQRTGVVQVAFGDYHYHALHSDGTISSYGHEPNGCGALGLGSGTDVGIPTGVLRGIRYESWNKDGYLLPHAYFRGRRIWFHPDQETWVQFLADGGRDPPESRERRAVISTAPSMQGEVSEWIEQMGSGWDKRTEVREKDEDGLGAYFALSVAAAGWHSGALVLVNDELVKAVADSCRMGIHFAMERCVERYTNALPGVFPPDQDLGPEPHPTWDLGRNEGSEPGVFVWDDTDFPRLKLDDGVEMPGTIPFSKWKEEKPEWNLEWRGMAFAGEVFGVAGWEWT
jgi:SCF-associated factor 1